MVDDTQSPGASRIASRTVTSNVPLHVRIVIVVSITLLVINASLLIVNTAATMDSHAEYARSYEIKRSLSTFSTVITAAESGQRGYLLTGQTGYLEPYYVAMRSWRSEIDRLRNLTADNAARQQDIADLEQLTAAAISRLKATISRSPQPGPNGNADVAGTERATTTMDRVRGIVDRMTAEEDARIEALRREVLRDLLVAGGIALLTTVVTVAVLIGLNKLLRKYVRDRENAENAMLEANQVLNEQVEQRTAELTELSQHLIRVSEEENEVIEVLRPSHLDNLGLAFAMRSHCREFTRRTGLPCDVEVQEDFDDLDPAWSIALYRIAQESLTNITKHAQASRVRITLIREDGGIRLRIVDDGVGLAEESLSKPKSHGIVGMRERMRQMGGRFQIRRPEEGPGTVVEAFIPNSSSTPAALTA
jgi:CHASE3 domain sensor protein/two-component sensor histidine kinase